MDMLWNIPCSFGPDNFVEPDVSAHIWSSHLFPGKFPDVCQSLRGRLLETHSMDMLVNAAYVFSGHYLIDDRMALLFVTPLSGSHSAGPWLEKSPMVQNSSVVHFIFMTPKRFLLLISAFMAIFLNG